MNGQHRDLQSRKFRSKAQTSRVAASLLTQADNKTIRIADLFPAKDNLFGETKCRLGEWKYHTLASASQESQKSVA